MNDSIFDRCRKGDRIAQKYLFDTYSNGMLLVCKRYVKNSQDAEEVLLNGFYKFFSTISRFQYANADSVGGWLRKIMINECLMFLRQKKNIVFVEERHAENVSLNGEVFEKLNAETIRELIDSLPDGYRIVFTLFVIEGYGHKEIATLLGISEGGSKSQLNRAKGLLQTKLDSKRPAYEQR